MRKALKNWYFFSARKSEFTLEGFLLSHQLGCQAKA